MQVHLTVTDGPHQGRVFAFQEHDNFIVGRSKRAQFRLPLKDRKLSRVHFMVEVNPPHCRLMDLCSTNGTLVNGKKVTAADLKDGDRIQAGETTLALSVVKDSAVDRPVQATAEYRSVVKLGSSFTPGLNDLADADAVGSQAVRTAAASGPIETTSPYHPTLGPEPRTVSARGSRSGGASFSAACLSCGEPIELPGGLLPLEDAALVCDRCRARAALQPQSITGYQIIRELGKGGMGVVYLALREADDSVVALKTVNPAISATPAQLERFLREANILRELQHPHIVGFRDLGECHGTLFFAMDYVPGSDAFHILQKEGPLAVPRAVDFTCQLLTALEFAHGKGFVHRDIKPANLLVSKMGEKELVKLADFGLARVYQTSQLSGLTMTGDLGGTLAYIAPEQITHYREAKPPADQYSAAATLYNLLTNDIPFEGGKKPQLLISRILQEPPIPIQSRRPEVPRAVSAIIHRALAKEPLERFPSARAMRLALQAQFGQ